MSEVVSPWLTIVIPAYNAEDCIEDCIASIDPAANSDVEVIVVDDGSTDGTGLLCDRFAEICDNLRVIHRDNGGSPSARNRGLAEGNGEWVWFVDSDDIISPSALPVLRSMSESPFGLIAFGFSFFNMPADVDWQGISPAFSVRSGEDLLRDIYAETRPNYVPLFLFRRLDLVSRGGTKGPFPECYSLYEDAVFTRRYLLNIEELAYSDAHLYGVRHNPNSMTNRRNSRTAASGLAAVREIACIEVPNGCLEGRIRIDVGLLLSAYKLVEDDDDSQSLKNEIRNEIDTRVKELGLRRLGPERAIKCVALKMGLLDLAVQMRSSRGGAK